MASSQSPSRHLAVLLGLCVLLSSGCLARQVGADGRNFRQSLLDMYTDQAMDNLIRAYDNHPFIQLAYRNLTITDTQKSKANIGNEYDPTTNKTIVQATTALIARSQQFTDHLMFGGNLETDRQMQFTADPVVGKSETYDYYRAFAQDPDLFNVSDKEPPFPVYLKKKHGDRWYYVSCEHGGVFQQLVLRTALMLGQETPPPVFWPIGIASVSPPRLVKPPGAIPPYYLYTIVLSQPVPNDAQAYLLVALCECPKRRRLVSLLPDPRQDPNAQFTDTFVAHERDPLWEIAGCRARFYSSSNPNMGRASSDELRLKAALDAFRQYQTQQP